MQLLSFVSCTLSGLVFLVFFSYLNKWKALSGIPKRGDNLEKHSTNKSQHFPHTKLVVCPSVTIIIVPCYCRGTSRIRRGGPLTNSTSDVMRLKRGQVCLATRKLVLDLRAKLTRKEKGFGGGRNSFNPSNLPKY